jgi:hypothetical protein
MVQKRSFDKDYLKKEFDKVDSTVKKGIVLYLIGGGAMAFLWLESCNQRRRHNSHKSR